MRVDRLIAWTALATLGAGTALLLYGADASNQALREQRTGVRQLAPDTEFVRSFYERAVPDDLGETRTIASALELAGHAQDAQSLRIFHWQCTVDRLLMDDSACRGQTVRAAIAQTPSVQGRPPPPITEVEGALQARLGEALSFSLDDLTEVPVPHDNPENFASRYGRVDGVVWAGKERGGYVFLALTNRSTWSIADFRLKLELPGWRTNPALELDCSRRVWPFRPQPPLQPGATAHAICPIGTIELERLLPAIREAREPGALSVRVESFVIDDPFLRVMDRGREEPLRFTVEPELELSLTRGGGRFVVQEQIRAVGCEQTGTCPSALSSMSQAVFEALTSRPLLLVAACGLLCALVVGGFAQRVWRRGLEVGALIVVVFAAALALFVQYLAGEGDGFGSLAAAAIVYFSILAALVWTPAYLVGVAAMSRLRAHLSAREAT